MKDKIIFLYANQIVLSQNGCYYTQLKNFFDFLIELTNQGENYRILLPCRRVKVIPQKELILLPFPQEKLIELPFNYYSRMKIFSNFLNFFYTWSKVLTFIKKIKK
jgi:hypothetical protein